MNKFFIFIFFFISIQLSSAQDSIRPQTRDTSWKTTGFFGINASQTSLSNWQGGGQNNVAVNGILNFNAVYKRDAFEQWTNKLDAQYGIFKPGNVPFRKNIDQLFALSKYEILAFKKSYFYTIQADYRTQFAPGYKYDGNNAISGNATSDMNSPGYLQLALGLDYKPTDYFSITLAPAAGKVTFVNRQYLADAGAYGVQPATYDADSNIVNHGKKIRYEFGGRVIIKFKKDIFKNVNFDSYLDLFSNYFHNPQNIDVVFNNLITFKVNKYLSASIICQMIYDDDIIIKRVINGKELINGPRLQALTTVGIGLGYKF